MNHNLSLLAAALFIACINGCAEPQRTGIDEAAAQAEPPAMAAVVRTPDQEQFAEAVHLYRSGRWSAAYGRFVELADRDHKYAAVISLQMLTHGPNFYRTEWSATAQQVAHWERVAQTKGPVGDMGAGD
jgi:hypothetical protein